MKLAGFFLVLMCSCIQESNPVADCEDVVKKINGISFVASINAINLANVVPVVNVNANYVAIMPFAFLKSLDNPNLEYNTSGKWFGERKEGVKQYAEEFNKKGVKIMLKPQIWVWKGAYSGDIKMKSEADWLRLEKTYTLYILDCAKVANEINATLFCFGTELRNFVDHRPKYWITLIKEIKEIYKGKLTYAANWDEFKYIKFWKQVDYIGVDAYFPVSQMKTPSVADCRKGWKQHKLTIQSIAKTNSKPVLFTEFGYCSVDYTGKEPWDPQSKVLNLTAQANSLQALYDEYWHEEWFAGGFVWKWFHNYEQSGGVKNMRFTPQNKPAEDIIRKAYK